MFEYADCDDDDCWYKNNTDRLNEYEKSYKVRDNYEEDTIKLCDVCIESPEYNRKCSVCKKFMKGDWVVLDKERLKLDETLRACFECVRDDDICEYIFELCGGDRHHRIFKNVEFEDADFKELRRGLTESSPKFFEDKILTLKKGEKKNFSRVLWELIDKKQEERREKKALKKRNKQAHINRNRDIIRAVFKVPDPCALEVAKRVGDATIPNYSKRSLLLLWLTEKNSG